MGFGKRVIGLLTGVFLAAAVLAGAVEYSQTQTFAVSAEVAGPTYTERIRGWQKEPGEFYIFLPGYASLDGTILQVSGGRDAGLEGTPIGSGLSLEGFSTGQAYALSYREKGQRREATLTVLQSGNLPTLCLDVQSGSLEYIRAARGNQESAVLRLYSPEGIRESHEVRSVNVRGNATFDEDKVPLGISLEKEADLLGMGTAEKWVLLANAYDASHLNRYFI